jgi:hypothetical protein
LAQTESIEVTSTIDPESVIVLTYSSKYFSLPQLREGVRGMDFKREWFDI